MSGLGTVIVGLTAGLIVIALIKLFQYRYQRWTINQRMKRMFPEV